MPSAKSKNGITSLLDKSAFAKLSYYGQWEEIIRTVQLEGNLEAIPVMVIHLIWSAIQFGIFWNITKYCGGDDLQQFSIQHWNLIVKNLILYCFITATLAINGMYQGPLLGEPFFRLTALRFMPGTIKEPFFSFFGNRRTVLDVVLYISTIGTAVWVMITPNPTKLQVRGYLAVVGLQWATDYACWVGSDGMFHGVLAFALCSMYGGLTFDGTLNRTMDDYRGGVAAMQLFLGYLYFGCGMGKMGIWFSRVFVQEWTTPPWAVGNIFLRNLFYKDVEGKDYNPTKFAIIFSYVAASCEWTPPLLFLLTDDVFHFGNTPTYIGLLILEAMHLYIIFHLPLADVNYLNILPGILLYYSFVVYPNANGNSIGYDLEGIKSMNVYIGSIMTFFACYCVYGHLNTDKVTYTCAWRFWAGNWPQGYYLITTAGMAKLVDGKNLVKIGKPWLDNLHPNALPTKQHCVVQAYRILGASWLAQLCGRVLPKTIELAIKLGGGKERKLSDYDYVMHCMGLNQFVGGVMGNCSLRSKFTIKRLQEACKFKRGELLYVHVDSFAPMLYSNKTTWEVHDAKDGLLAAGTTTTDECIALKNPTLCKHLNFGKEE